MEFHFGTIKTESIAFSQYFVLRSSQVDMLSFPPTNCVNVSDWNNEDLNDKVDEEVWALMIALFQWEKFNGRRNDKNFFLL